MFRYALLLFAIVVSVAFAPVLLDTEPAQAVPNGFRDVRIVGSFGQPTALAFTPNGRMLATDKLGELRVYRQNGLPLATLALDLTDKVCSNVERGLLGGAVDPFFENNGYVYLYYTYKKFPNATEPCPERKPTNPNNPVNRVSRFVMTGNTIDPRSERVLIDNIPSTAGSHNAGDLHFGKDRLLYVSVGDGGCDYAQPINCGAFNDAAQDTHALVGKILRVTRGGAIPDSNPYTGPDSERCGGRGDDGRTEPGKRCQEIFTTGLRNPFRMAFDPDANRTRFFINDVGQLKWEEIDLGRRGADYGWNFCEGTHDNLDRPGTPDCTTSPFTPPLHEYSHDPQPDGRECRSITGGAFVPDAADWPAVYSDAYLFGDYICNKIFKLTPKSGGGFTRTVFANRLARFGPIYMTFGPYGSSKKALYYTTFADGGQIHRIFFTS